MRIYVILIEIQRGTVFKLRKILATVFWGIHFFEHGIEIFFLTNSRDVKNVINTNEVNIPALSYRFICWTQNSIAKFTDYNREYFRLFFSSISERAR